MGGPDSGPHASRHPAAQVDETKHHMGWISGPTMHRMSPLILALLNATSADLGARPALGTGDQRSPAQVKSSLSLLELSGHVVLDHFTPVRIVPVNVAP